MGLSQQIFTLNNQNYPVYTFVDNKDRLWFKGNDIGNILAYKRPRSAILKHVLEKNKICWRDLMALNESDKSDDASVQIPFHPRTTFITTIGLGELLCHSKQTEAISLFRGFINRLSLINSNILDDTITWAKENPIEPVDKSGYVYVASSDMYKEDNVYKIGCAKNPPTRLTSLNNGHRSVDRLEFIKTFKFESDYKTAEYREGKSEFFKVDDVETITNAIKNVSL
ncbi:putative Bro-N domain-containing protein 9 [Diachasmimorpha longicaudata entomopoxvirus]|uniref:Putative Bro-N domain-containing protein 9 n=1 Tax=Diachasmimorpha longicaudata entomopoxvirus TaxID=109981 RepID=A0A7R5WK42_9POXV|nr:putative Bro-N domain-containing protein 9 [Diachasmimorpha longicaudata entomopoxvirus]AKS26391.1 putative Bro-N domain-containing protein 9 [Diachasmimorpha longicaudata entomopoxvirus]